MPLQIIRHDITQMRVDAIVNTTNEEMIGYSGVDLAVHTVAGEELDAECARIAPLGLGQAKITGGYKLPCKYVIHTSGPVWRGGILGESALLRSCYVESLKLAVENHCQSIAFPLISAGVYGYPKDKALKVAIDIISDFLLLNDMLVYIVVFDKTAYQISEKLFADIEHYLDEYYEPEDDGYCNRVSDRKADILCMDKMLSSCEPKQSENLEALLDNLDETFSSMLLRLIDEKGCKDSEVYKKANVDRKLFSKIRSNPAYHPRKQTVLALAIALKLDLDGTVDLLSRAEYALSPGNKGDLIVKYFIERGIYDIQTINFALYEYDLPTLG